MTKKDMDIIVTNPDHVPKENHFHEIVSSNLRDVEYNPDKEKRKYSFDKINKLRKEKRSNKTRE